MTPLGRGPFDIYALALPRGLGFGDRPPFEAWQSNDGIACAILTRDVGDGSIGLIVMRRRADDVWTVTMDAAGMTDVEAVRARAASEIKEGEPPEPLPSNQPRRPPLHDPRGRELSPIFRMLASPTHRHVAWLLNQLYLSLPRPDRNWAGDCQTENFHARLWEAQLLASFREQGLHVAQPIGSPDFRIENRRGEVAWIEAVTANPRERFEPVGAQPTFRPVDPTELFFGNAALRFAKTIGSKLQRRYPELEQVAGKPFALALADFHAAASMMWSREALIGYLYGVGSRVVEVEGKRVAIPEQVDYLLGGSAFPAGLFANGEHDELSAVIFTNACTLSKFNRRMISSGASDHGYRYVRYGKFFDRSDGAFDGIPFCLDVASEKYRRLWHYGYEPWCAELEVFHNPFARHPLPETLLPEATHWIEVDGQLVSRPFYSTNILWSGTIVQKKSETMPTYETVPSYLAELTSRQGDLSEDRVEER